MSNEDSASGRSIRWFHEIKVDGTVAFRAGKQGARMVADWPGLGTLICERDGTGAKFAPVEGAGAREVHKLRQAQVKGLLRDLAGQIAVHASAVALEGRGLLFLGPDGAGKSTAAAEMCVRHGAQLLADDAASVEVGTQGVRIFPSEEDHWLTAQSRMALDVPHPTGEAKEEKHELRASRVAGDPCSLALVMFLRFDPAATRAIVRRPRGSDAARWLLEAVIRFDVEDGAARSRELQQLTTVYESAVVLEVVRPAVFPGGIASFVLDALNKQGKDDP